MREDEAAKLLGRAQQVLDAEKQKLDELNSYFDEYCDAYRSSGQGAVNPAQLQNYLGFLNNLELAIQQQKRQVQMAEMQLSHSRNTWTSIHHKRKNIGKLADKAAECEESSAEKKLQKEIDDRYGRTTGC